MWKTPFAWSAICEQIAARTPSDNPPERSQPDNLTSAFKRFVNKNELGPLRFQDLRHTHATLLLRDGIYVKIVSERLGHASVAITLDTYAHVLPGMQAEAAARLDSIMKNALGQLGK